MPLSESKIDLLQAKNILKEKYNIFCKDISKIPGGSANLYKVIANNLDKYVIKEYQDNFNLGRVEIEIEVSNLLSQHGIQTAEFIKTITNKDYVTNKNNIIVVQKYIDGIKYDFHTLNKQQYLEAAKYLRRIVDILNESNVNLPFFNMDIFEENFISKTIEKCDYLSARCEDSQILDILKIKKRMLEKSKTYDFSEIYKVTFLKSHGDYNKSQIIYDDFGHIKAIIDFASAKKLPIVWDLLRSFIFMDSSYQNGGFDLEHFIEYLQCFNNHNVLNEYDIKYMFLVYYMYILNSTFGLEQYIFQSSEQYRSVGIDLYEQTHFLYNNMSDMQKILLKRQREVL